MNPQLSVITPVYNVDSYLNRCVQSILTQSFHDLELILVDDGSTDGSSLLCDEWGNKDQRVIVVHKENGGVSSARNAGLEVAKGDYLTFVDPDDFIAPDTYGPNMSYLMENPEVDFLQFPYCHFVSYNQITHYHKPSSSLLMGAEQIFENWWSGSPLEYVVWNKIYKRTMWNGICFKIGHISEDTCLVPDFIQRVKVCYISECGLYYYQRERLKSYTFGEYSFDKHLDLFYAHVSIFEVFKQFPKMTTEKVLAFTRLYRRLIIAKQTDMSADISEPLTIVKQNFPTVQEILSSKKTEKLWLLVAKILGCNLFVRLFLRYLNK